VHEPAHALGHDARRRRLAVALLVVARLVPRAHHELARVGLQARRGGAHVIRDGRHALPAARHEHLRHYQLFHAQEHAVLAAHAERCARAFNRLESVFDLKQTTIG
jgi:hypothetical protein